jgi:hypothetical protein
MRLAVYVAHREKKELHIRFWSGNLKGRETTWENEIFKDNTKLGLNKTGG